MDRATGRPRLAFIDWMKTVGMLLIVYGHIAGSTINGLTHPILPKQLGVAFFVFVMGYSLARERRAWPRVLFNRSFEIYLFGLAIALMVSAAVWWRAGDLNESNYLPFLFGANVVLNYFPANPTTWYVGTYLHLLVLWALLLRRVELRPWMLAASAAVEIALRALLMASRGNFVAYMALPNWGTVFLLGLFYGQRVPAEEVRRRALPRPVAASLLLVPALWPLATRSLVVGRGFPFQRLVAGAPVATLLVTSTAITFLYLGYTWIAFQLTRTAPDLAPVRFFARNTLVIFLAHMPLVYAFQPRVRELVPNPWLAGLVGVGLYYVLLGGVSEAALRAVRPKELRDAVWERLQPLFARLAPQARGA